MPRSTPIEVASFSRSDEAHIVKTRLEHEGIACLLLDEHVNRIYGQVVSMRLFVESSDAERARKLVMRFRNFQVVDEDESA